MRALQLAHMLAALAHHLVRVRAWLRVRARDRIRVRDRVRVRVRARVRVLALAHHRVYHVDRHLEHLVRVRVGVRGRVKVRDLVAHLHALGLEEEQG